SHLLRLPHRHLRADAADLPPAGPARLAADAAAEAPGRLLLEPAGQPGGHRPVLADLLRLGAAGGVADRDGRPPAALPAGPRPPGPAGPVAGRPRPGPGGAGPALAHDPPGRLLALPDPLPGGRPRQPAVAVGQPRLLPAPPRPQRRGAAQG